MGGRNVRNGFDFRHPEDSKVGFPLVKPVQRIMIRTQISWNRGDASDGLLEHPAERKAIDDASLNSKPDDSPRALVHHDQYPIRSQDDRLASK
jgi:hypothetical protein